MPGPRPSLARPSRGVFGVQAVVPLSTSEGFATRQVGPQLFEAPFSLVPPLFFSANESTKRLSQPAFSRCLRWYWSGYRCGYGSSCR